MRTPLTIFALGIGACLALGLMMQHLLRVSQERKQPAVLVEVNRVYGPRLDCEARLRFLPRPHGKVAEFTIRPLLTGVARDLALEIGGFVWRNYPDSGLAGVEVLCEDPLGAPGERFVIERPRSRNSASPPAPPPPGPSGGRGSGVPGSTTTGGSERPASAPGTSASSPPAAKPAPPAGDPPPAPKR